MSFFTAMFPRFKATFLYAVALLTLSSCSTTAPRHVWVQRALDAETAQVAGQFAIAEREYHVLLPDAPSVDKRRWVQLNLAKLALATGEEDVARERLRDLANSEPRDLWGANAALQLCDLRSYDDACYVGVIRRFPEEIASERALRRLGREFTDRGEFAKFDELLTSLADEDDIRDSELGDNLWFAAAENRYDNLRDPDGALDAYRTLHDRYRKGPLADDALWEMANIYRDHQHWQPALALLDKISEEVESSWFIGSYESNWVDNAMYDRAVIRMLFLEEYDAAAKNFREFLRRDIATMLADDAAWHLAHIERLRGDEAAYRRAIRDFVEQFPDSRLVRRVPPELLP